MLELAIAFQWGALDCPSTISAFPIVTTEEDEPAAGNMDFVWTMSLGVLRLLGIGIGGWRMGACLGATLGLVAVIMGPRNVEGSA